MIPFDPCFHDKSIRDIQVAILFPFTLVSRSLFEIGLNFIQLWFVAWWSILPKSVPTDQCFPVAGRTVAVPNPTVTQRVGSSAGGGSQTKITWGMTFHAPQGVQ